MSLLVKALKRQNNQRPPVWFMRQAGRYHQHYQKLRARHSFEDLCKIPTLATETTMGPIQDFDFDAAILFSDILFPLEVLGIPLRYNPGPQLGFLLTNRKDYQKLRHEDPQKLVNELAFQAEAISLIRSRLNPEKALIGFVGSPLTLFYFATYGGHKNLPTHAHEALLDGRYDLFMQLITPLLTENIRLQADAGCDAMAIFDTCAGDVSSTLYQKHVVPVIKTLIQNIKTSHPTLPIIYYAKNTDPSYWEHLPNGLIDALGIDWKQDLTQTLATYHDQWAIQGNFDPHILRDVSKNKLDELLTQYFTKILQMDPSYRRGWICGLGHGVLPQTPEENVRLFIEKQREMFS